MRILVHDYCGHPFQIQLSRTLAARKHEVLHLYSGSLQSPHGNVSNDGDSENPYFQIRAIHLPHDVAKYSPVKRYWQELRYARLLRAEIHAFSPDIVLSANTPLAVQRQALKASKAACAQFVFWLQDMLGVGIKNVVASSIPLIGGAIGNYFVALEEQLLHESDAVITITHDFEKQLLRAGVRSSGIVTIPNWAPLEEMPLMPKVNAWSQQYSFESGFNFIYSGTLGLKHNTDILIDLARRLESKPDCRLIVCSEGLGAEWLREQQRLLGLSNLHVMDYVAYHELPRVLAAADVLLGILDVKAGVFSVPSKVMTYHCAGKAILLAVPPENLVSRIVTEHQTGIAVPPNDHAAFCAAAMNLYNDEQLRARLGANARRYAEQTFDIEAIADRFEALFTTLSSPQI